MRVISKVISDLHLNPNYCLLTARSVAVMLEYFRLLDVHNTGYLNDIQFYCFMKMITNLTSYKIEKVLKMLDDSGSGLIDFATLYPFICLVVAMKDGIVKKFVLQHSKFVFKMLDEDNEGTISAREMKDNGFIFNLDDQNTIKHMFLQFDVSRDDKLSFKEFKMFAMAAIETEDKKKTKKKEKEMRKKIKKEKMPRKI